MPQSPRYSGRWVALATVVVGLVGAVAGVVLHLQAAAAGAPHALAATATPATPTPISPTAAASTASPSPTRPATVTVAALGDSVPAGSACHCTTYVRRVAVALGRELKRIPVVHNLAAGGLTSGQVRDSLSTPAIRRSLAAADLTIIEVGANDFSEHSVSDPSCEPAATSACYAATLARLRTNIRRIISTVESDEQVPGAEVVVLGYWNVFKDGAVGRARGGTYVAGSDDLTRVVNGALRQAAEENGAIYVDAYSPFKGTGDRDATGDLAADGDHPNDAGHELLAQAVLDALQATLVTASPSAS